MSKETLRRALVDALAAEFPAGELALIAPYLEQRAVEARATSRRDQAAALARLGEHVTAAAAAPVDDVDQAADVVTAGVIAWQKGQGPRRVPPGGWPPGGQPSGMWRDCAGCGDTIYPSEHVYPATGEVAATLARVGVEGVLCAVCFVKGQHARSLTGEHAGGDVPLVIDCGRTDDHLGHEHVLPDHPGMPRWCQGTLTAYMRKNDDKAAARRREQGQEDWKL